MTREEAIRELKADYCGNRIICELYPDQCNREDCEIWLAIKALEIQPDGDAVSRRTVIETVKDADVCVCYSENESVEIENVIDLAIMATKRSVIAIVEQMPSAQPEPLSDAYTKAVWTWLLDYQIKAAELKGRYTPYEVLSWVANDWRKEHDGSD